MTSTSPQKTEETGSRIEERRERQRSDARQAIMNATEALIIESGGSDFSIRSLGQRSGYSAPTVYHYFGDKDGLIDALLEDRFGLLASEFERLEPSGDPRRDLRAMLIAYFDFATSNPAFTRVMGTLSRKGESRMPPAMDRVRSCVEARLERFGEAGQLGGFDSESAGRMLWALARGLVSMRIMEPEAVWPEDLIARALDSMFLGMAELDAENKS
ncbi:MAG: TetR/AcrR family transcriptional regulator [Myxococcota bacterium]